VVVLFRLLTAVDVTWRRLIPGAAAAAIAWSAVQAVGVLIVSQQIARANLLYGVFAVVLVLLSWMLLTGRILIYAAEVNVVLARRLWPRSLLQPPLTEQDRRALTALARTGQLRPEQHVDVTFGGTGVDADDADDADPRD
jgi:uncharacterized BrkB/YihY/UPF0761 family membrane protein